MGREEGHCGLPARISSGSQRTRTGPAGSPSVTLRRPDPHECQTNEKPVSVCRGLTDHAFARQAVLRPRRVYSTRRLVNIAVRPWWIIRGGYSAYSRGASVYAPMVSYEARVMGQTTITPQWSIEH